MKPNKLLLSHFLLLTQTTLSGHEIRGKDIKTQLAELENIL